MKTTDLSDAHPHLPLAAPILRHFGKRTTFFGPIRTVQCFEDNSFVKRAVETPGAGAVLVVDGGGSVRCALLGDLLAAKAIQNGWAGLVIWGCVRDTEVLAQLDLGVMALAAHPRRSEKRSEGRADVPVRFAGLELVPGHYLYADADGILVSPLALQ